VLCSLPAGFVYSNFLSGTVKAIAIGTLAHMSAVLVRLRNSGTQKTGGALEGIDGESRIVEFPENASHQRNCLSAGYTKV